MFKSVIFICTGNICRSPMAEALFKDKVQEHQLDVNVSSAGLGALVNYPADKMAIQLMNQKQIDISNHRARQLTKEIVAENELIITMTQQQKQELENRFPQSLGRVFRIAEQEGFDVVDPFKRPEIIFQQSLAQIEYGLEHWYKMYALEEEMSM